jgi:Uma2 family endonuclease
VSTEPLVDQRWRFTVEEYERMGQVGIFDEDDRVELLDGEIVAMSPIGPKHASIVNRVSHLLFQRLAGLATVIAQNPLRLPPRSEPQPDFILARARRDFYAAAHPTAEDVFLVIEVADSTLCKDRMVKVPIYARQGVVEVWLVDVAGGTVTVYTDPVDGSYRQVRTVRGDERITSGSLSELTFTVNEILGE